jgi:hypothetical protein
MDEATRLGRSLLRATTLTLAQVKGEVEAARQANDEAHRYKRIRLLIDEMGFVVRVTERRLWLADLKRLTQQLTEVLSATTQVNEQPAVGKSGTERAVPAGKPV